MNSVPTYTPSQLNQLNDLFYKLEKLGVIDYSLYLSSSSGLWLKHSAHHYYTVDGTGVATRLSNRTIATNKTNIGNK